MTGQRRIPVLRLVICFAVVGALIGGLVAVITRAGPNSAASSAAELDGVRFSAHLMPDSGQWPLALLDPPRIDHDRRYGTCVDAVTALSRSGAAAMWGGGPVEITVRTDQASVMEINWVVLKVVAVEPLEAAAGAFSCAPEGASPQPAPTHRLSSKLTELAPGDKRDADIDPMPDGAFTKGFEFILGAGETRSLEVRPHLPTGGIVRWTIELSVSDGGEPRTIELDNGGQPFVSLSTDLRNHVKSRWEVWGGAAADNRIRPVTDLPGSDRFDMAKAAEVILGEQFDPPITPGPPPGPLRALEAMCTGNPHGRCWNVFFFDGPRLAGRIKAGLLDIIAQDGQEVVVEFPQYTTGDGLCCPSGRPTRHIVRLVDGEPRAEPPVPDDANNVAAAFE
jgi:hypothetical protein